MSQTTPTIERGLLPKTTTGETLAVLAEVVIPSVAKGAIIRRPRMVALSEWLDLDRRGIRRVQALRDKYGPGPLLLSIPFRRQALILSPEHVRRVLDESPEPFAADSAEKRASLPHFQPRGVLISRGPERADRRRFNEEVLDTEREVHHLSDQIFSIVDEEAAHLLAAVRLRDVLTWDDFAIAWFRVVRRIVLGDGARDDRNLTALIEELRSDANWAFLRPQRTDLRNRFYEQLESHLARAEPNSLAGVMAATPTTEATVPSHQVPQWLFAFDPAGMATFRTLALLASHPEHADRAQAGQKHLPYLRACVLESLRLWPTMPMVLRESRVDTAWESGVMPARTGIMIYAPFFHRDHRQLYFADRFSPEIWLEDQPREWALIPFSDGPVQCPGKNLVLMTTSLMVAALVGDWSIRLNPANWLDARRSLPGTLNNYSLRFELGR